MNSSGSFGSSVAIRSQVPWGMAVARTGSNELARRWIGQVEGAERRRQDSAQVLRDDVGNIREACATANRASEVVERIRRQVVLLQVRPRVSAGPVRHRVDLQHRTARLELVPVEDRCVRPRGRGVPPEGGDPRVELLERVEHRADLVDLAAQGRVALVQAFAERGRLLLDGVGADRQEQRACEIEGIEEREYEQAFHGEGRCARKLRLYLSVR